MRLMTYRRFEMASWLLRVLAIVALVPFLTLPSAADDPDFAKSLGPKVEAFLKQGVTPGAMVLAQTIIAFPVVAGFTMAAVMGVDPNLRQQVFALGATPWQATWAILMEARAGVVISTCSV